MNNIEKSSRGDNLDAQYVTSPGFNSRQKQSGFYTAICRDHLGNIKWVDKWRNRVVNEGLDHSLESTLGGGTQITSWFLGLTDGTPTDAAGDTLASHAGWSEESGYTGNRQACSFGATSGQSIDNSGSPASFAITGTATIGGGFLCSVATGTAGTLYSVGAFSGGDRGVVNGDTINLTYTATAADA